MRDAVDRIIEQWKNEGIDADLTPMETLGRITRLSALITRKLEENFAAYGLNRGEFDVLAALRRSGEPYTLSPTDLFDTLMVTSGTMTNRLINLEKRNLIGRVKSDTDKRSTLVRLTGEGKELVEKCLVAHMKTEAEMVSSLDAKTMEKLNAILKKLEAGF